MTLMELVGNLNQLSGDLTIYASKDPEWSESSQAVACAEPEDGTVPEEAQGMAYFLEVALAIDVIETWKQWRGGSEPTPKDVCRALIYYATNDAYVPV